MPTVRPPARPSSGVPLAEPVPPIGLSGLERWALESVHRRGIARFVVLLSGCAVFVSVFLVGLAWLFLEGVDDPGSWATVLVLSAIVPALVAPPLITFCARLIERLDTARRLLRESSVTDALTGVANRRGFFDAFDHDDWPGDYSSSVIGMVDIDGFKTINDTHGHGFGDRALVEVARWLADRSGDDGLVGRLGGDEFAFVARRSGGEVWPARCHFEVDGIGFSASIGTATVVGSLTTTALHEADQALYRSKRSRNSPFGRASGITR
ncbi:MAG: GGDEF domain-containing protein [Ilumatobacter fluminis]|uniref:GGDEF domain-containing protein n=1 Tax=Ilumatobacter fluminis TaxID=467091 RepID=UPI0032EC33EF